MPGLLFVCLYGVFTLHGTSGHSATGPTALRDFRTTSRVNFYHQKYTPLTPQWNGQDSNSRHRDGQGYGEATGQPSGEWDS